MTKKLFKYFFDFLDGQENWLNKMSKKGYRLVNTSKLFYEFEPCNPYEYEYHVEFIANKSYSEIKTYKDFLDEMGFITFTKNININYSLLKARWRPYGKGFGQLATNPGNYNKELLIIEKKKDNKAFDIYTDLKDLIKYYSSIRNSYLTLMLLFLGLILLNTSNLLMNSLSNLGVFVFAIIALLLMIPTFKYSRIIQRYKKEVNIQE